MLARLAVEQSVQGRGLGEVMLFDAVKRCASLADSLGVHAVEVQAIDDRAKAFYQKHGFDELIDDNLHLMLAIATIRDAIRPKHDIR